jgi:DNA-binding beta-propeller fold protein YncE
MIINDAYDGGADPFEGERTVIWRSLPSNAIVTKATIQVTPVAAAGGTLFEETITFVNSGAGSLGATRNTGSGFAEIDFHKRRTLARVQGTGVPANTGITGAHLQVDLGGLYVEINEKGAIRTPNDKAFAVPADGSLPGLTVSKFKLTPPAGVADLNLTSVTIRSVPTNVSVAVGALRPFWTHPGELSTFETSPDFSAVLQTALAKATVVSGFYAVPLVIHSDTVVRLRISIEAEFVLQSTLQPAGIKEVVIPYDFDSRPKAAHDVLSVELPRNARVQTDQTTAKVAGAFNDTRIVHGVPPGASAPPYALSLSSHESQAQLISPETPLLATAIDLLLATEATAELTLDLRVDLNGKPGGSSLLPAPVEFTIHPGEKDQPVWVSVSLPREFQFGNAPPGVPNSVCWLVLAVLHGEAHWSTEPAPPDAVGVQHTLDAGLSWHYASTLGAPGPLNAWFRLRRKPDVFTVPLQLAIGTGERAAPVDLDHYQPLARVDFSVDTPEFAHAFNTYLSSDVAPTCPIGEHLLNGDFRDWAASGNEIGLPINISLLSASASAVATSPDGACIYVAGAVEIDEETRALVLLVDPVCDELLSAIPVHTSDALSALVANATTNRVFAISGGALCIVDTAAGAQVGDAVLAASIAALKTAAPGTAHGSFRGELAISPDGARLYFAFGVESDISIVSADTSALEHAARGRRQLNASDVRFLSIAGIEARSMALSDNGLLLYVAMGEAADVQTIDTSSFTRSGSVELNDQPVAISFTPDGKNSLILTSGPDTRLHFVDTRSATDTGFIVLPSVSPIALVIAPDGSRAYALTTSNDAGVVIAIALPGREPRPPVPLETVGLAAAISAHGDRLFIVGDDAGLSFLSIGSRAPADWFVTSGTPSVPTRVLPVCLAPQSPAKLVVLFGNRPGRTLEVNTAAAGLSQVVPVSGPCGYEFSFLGLADDPDATAEIFWLDPTGALLRTDACASPFQERSTGFRSRGFATVRMPDFNLLPVRARLTSPPGAAQAEVRFTAPPRVFLLLAQASLKGTAQISGNADFQLAGRGIPTGWLLKAEYSRGVSVTTSIAGLRFTNDSPANAELVQSCSIASNRQYFLNLNGAAVGTSLGQHAPTVELHWLKPDGSFAAESVSVPLDTNGFTQYPTTGTVPTGTATAEIHLIAPPRSGLQIRYVSLETPTTVAVPVTFLAKAPGELRVSRSQITYNVVPPSPPAVPSTGTTTPTPPGGRPGEAPCNAYCPCCETEQPITNAQTRKTPGGRPLTVGVCATCGEELIRPGGRFDASPQLYTFKLLTHTPALRQPLLSRLARRPEAPPPDRTRAQRARGSAREEPERSERAPEMALPKRPFRAAAKAPKAARKTGFTKGTTEESRTRPRKHRKPPARKSRKEE